MLPRRALAFNHTVNGNRVSPSPRTALHCCSQCAAPRSAQVGMILLAKCHHQTLMFTAFQDCTAAGVPH